MILRRVQRAFSTAPQWRDILELFGAIALFAGLAALIAGDLAHWSPRSISSIALIALRAFFIPALGEELAFRAALVPARDEGGVAWLAIATSTLLFTLWHVVETTFLPGSAATFLRADFLALAAALGVLCAVLRWRSSSIWTAVALHWVVVVTWQGWFGGPSFGAS